MARAEDLIIAANPNRAKQRLATAALLGALGVETYLLLSEKSFFTPDPPRASSSRVAELAAAYNSVKVQTSGDLVWNPAKTGMPLERKQSVLTGDRARAEIAFLDGTGLVVDENSLIQVERSASAEGGGGERLSVRLLRGSLHRMPKGAEPGAPKFASLEVQVGDAKVAVAPTADVSLRADGEFLVRAGEVAVVAGTGATPAVKAGEEGRIAQDGSVAARKLPILLVAPRGGEVLTGSKVKFRWNVDVASIHGAAFQLEVSREETFQAPVARKTIPAASRPLQAVESELQLPPDEAPGQAWYWRVRAAGNRTIASGVERFTFAAPAPAIELRFPPAGSTASTEHAVDFSWTETQGATRYELELVGLGTQTSKQVFARVERLPAGEIDWRVRAVLADGKKSDWSATRKLMVRAPVPEEESLPPPAELFDPKIEPKAEPAAQPAPTHTRIFKLRGFFEWLADAIVASANAAEAEPERYQVHLKWQPVKGATRYRVQISKTQSFKDTLIEVQSDAPEWTWEYERGMENTKGRVFYRVASVSVTGKVGKYSAPKPIVLKKESKPVVATLNAPGKPQTFSATEGTGPVEDREAVHVEATKRQATDAGLVSVSEVEQPSAEAPTSQWSFFFGVGAAHQSQSGDAALASVSFPALYFQQHFGLEAMTAPRNQDRWTARLIGNVATYERAASATDSRMPEQPEVSAFRLRLDVLREEPEARRGVQSALGFTIDRTFQWEKTGLQTVDAQGSISAGPGIWASARLGRDGLLGASLVLPLTGFLTKDHWGTHGSLWATFPFWKLGNSWMSGRAQFDGNYTAWTKPVATRSTSWAFWIAPTIHLGSSGKGGGS